MSDRSAVLPQYLFPKQALTNFAGWVAGNEWGWITTRLIRNFIRDYDVDMNEAFTMLRSFARSHSRPLAEVAAAVVDRTLRL